MALPVYFPTSVAAGDRGPLHIRQAYYRGVAGHVLHPLQMTGQVPSTASDLMPVIPAFGGRSLGEPAYPAAWAPMQLPPIVATSGGPRDPNFQV